MKRIKTQSKRYMTKNGHPCYKYLYHCDLCDKDVWRHHSDNASCGCNRMYIEKDTLNNLWTQIKAICYNKNHRAYMFHGGRGRLLHKSWKNYIVFRDWAMKNGYEKGHSLHLIDIHGDYGPDNCVWKDKRADIKKRLDNE